MQQNFNEQTLSWTDYTQKEEISTLMSDTEMDSYVRWCRRLGTPPVTSSTLPSLSSSMRLQITALNYSLRRDRNGRQRQPNIHHDQSETYVSLQYPFSDTRLQDSLRSSAPNPTLCPVLASTVSEERHTRRGWMSNAINPKSIRHFTFSFYLSSQGDFNKAPSYKLSPSYTLLRPQFRGDLITWWFG